MTKLTRLSVLVALVATCAVAATASAASADTVTCNTAGTVKLSPGLTTTAATQNVTVKGTLSECTGTETNVTSGKYIAHLKSTEEIGCSALTGSAPATGTIVIKWTPKGSGNSMGTFTMPVTEAPGALIGGFVESGPFIEDTIAGSVSQTYTGGPTCGVAEGKKKAKKVNKGTLTGTLTIS